MNQDDPGCDGSDDSSGPSNVVGELSLDTCLELLANHQRRMILAFFMHSDREHATIDEIVTEIVEYEARETGQRPGHDSVSATLFHVHLPKFSDLGVLEYDPRHLEVRYHGNRRIEDVYSRIRDLE